MVTEKEINEFITHHEKALEELRKHGVPEGEDIGSWYCILLAADTMNNFWKEMRGSASEKSGTEPRIVTARRRRRK